MADGIFIVGDGSGGGGACGNYGGTAGGAGGGGADTVSGSGYNDVIFGDGSGGGGGGFRFSGMTDGAGGAGGGGNDTLLGGAGDDILFGDGFNGDSGSNTATGYGGLGGGGAGGNWSYMFSWGGIGAGDGGRSYNINGGFSTSAAKDGTGSYTGSGGATLGKMGGGGGGFGDTGDGGNVISYSPGGSTAGGAGGTHQYSMTDTGGSIYNTLLSEVTAGNIYNSTDGTTSGYGAGSDTLDGGAGSDHYFGMGGADTFVVSEQDNAGTDADTIWDFNRTDGDQIKLEDASGNVIDTSGIDTLLAAADTSSGDTVITMSDGSTVTIKGVTDLTSADFETACFLPGTQFETANGIKAIEELQIGDLLKTQHGFQPLKWLAHRRVDWSMSIPRRVAPVRVKQGALGNGLPLRDLYVSPAHALLIDGVLINAELLVNGHDIVQLLDFNQDFSYFNIELDEHAIVYAEGLPVESYLEVGDNRRSYDNATEFHAQYPQHRPARALELGRLTLKRQLPRRCMVA